MPENDQQQPEVGEIAHIAFKNLIVAVMIDGKVEPSEREWVHYARRLLGLDVNTANSYIEQMTTQHLRIQIPKAPDEKELCFDLMVAACKADGTVQPQERALLRKFGPRFGHTQAEIEEKIKTITLQTLEQEVKADMAAALKRAAEGGDDVVLEFADPPEKEYTFAESTHVAALELKGARLRMETIIGHLIEGGANKMALEALDAIRADIEKAEETITSRIRGAGQPVDPVRIASDLEQMCINMRPHIDSPVGQRFLKDQKVAVIEILNTVGGIAHRLANRPDLPPGNGSK